MNDFDRQRELEISSVTRGVERYMTTLKADQERGREFDTTVGQRLVTKMVGSLLPSVIDIQKEARARLLKAHTVGTRLQGWEIAVEASDPQKLAYITVRTVLSTNSVGNSSTNDNFGNKVVQARRIGQMVNLELRWEELRKAEKQRHKDEPDTFNRVERMKRTVKQINPRSVRKWLKMMDDISTTNWEVETRIKLGLVMLGLLLSSCSEYVVKHKHQHTIFGTKKTAISIHLRDEVRKSLEADHYQEAESNPWFLPMVCEPKEWEWKDDKFTGGYLTHDIPIVKRGRWKHTFDIVSEANVPQSVLTALNVVSRTKWAINKEILVVATEAAEAGKREVLPVEPLRDLPPKISADVWSKMSTTERGKVRGERRATHDHNNRLQAKRDAMWRKLSICEEFKDEPQVYFPHNLDFRGRTYPIPQDLHPQSDDFARGLLRFAEAVPLGNAGFNWLLYHTASTYGMDKISRVDQAQWCIEHMEELRAVAVDPFGGGYAFWCEAEEPWQFLAAAKELDAAFQHPEGVHTFPSSLPVYVDGSCNGLQHLSAMGLDPIGAHATNLTPNPERQDIYQIVADKVNGRILSHCQTNIDGSHPFPDEFETAIAWQPNVSRKVVKRGVMTVPYGLTDIGMRDQLISDRWTDDIEGDAMKNANYLRDLMKEAIASTVVKATEIMEWMQDNATILAQNGKAVEWTTPSGFRVRQAYHKVGFKDIRTIMGRGRLSTIITKVLSDEMLVRKQSLSIAPNIVHSFDAAHMVMTIDEAASVHGFGSFAVVHDSFGCHAAHMDNFLSVVRKKFVDIYEQDWFASLQAEFQAMAGPDIPLIKPPAKGDFDISQVADAQYFFA